MPCLGILILKVRVLAKKVSIVGVYVTLR